MAGRGRRATSSSKRSNSPCSSHLRNQPYTVRQCGPPGGSARHGPPMRRCQAMARTTAVYGVARLLRGGSSRSNQRATCATAFNDTISFRRASWRARCASVHICPLTQTTKITVGSDRDQPNRPTQTGSERGFSSALRLLLSPPDYLPKRLVSIREHLECLESVVIP